MNSLALKVQEGLGRDPHAGDLYVFRGRRGDMVKCLWHDGLGMSLYAKRLERGRFIWPSPVDGAVAISASQLAYLARRDRLAQSPANLEAALGRIGCGTMNQPAVIRQEEQGSMRVSGYNPALWTPCPTTLPACAPPWRRPRRGRTRPKRKRHGPRRWRRIPRR
ncbi:IS66 family insertion sequence element accessory protein TnpB [Azospirillum sp. INR13]|uniref:IS66 family insertion sequence element accessory protein TnpB n=1 Tax=Azospirillum sp. INR13 TaxID=2596919 RepID=UPI00351C689B